MFNVFMLADIITIRCITYKYKNAHTFTHIFFFLYENCSQFYVINDSSYRVVASFCCLMVDCQPSFTQNERVNGLSTLIHCHLSVAHILLMFLSKQECIMSFKLSVFQDLNLVSMKKR